MGQKQNVPCNIFIILFSFTSDFTNLKLDLYLARYKSVRFINKQVNHFSSIRVQSDIDECSEGSSQCDENAECINTEGSYSCTCKQGFDGDGIDCKGIT